MLDHLFFLFIPHVRPFIFPYIASNLRLDKTEGSARECDYLQLYQVIFTDFCFQISGQRHCQIKPILRPTNTSLNLISMDLNLNSQLPASEQLAPESVRVDLIHRQLNPGDVGRHYGAVAQRWVPVKLIGQGEAASETVKMSRMQILGTGLIPHQVFGDRYGGGHSEILEALRLCAY